jgi:hypothetical protein
MINKVKLLVALLLTLMAVLTGCSTGGSNNFPNPGFTLQTQRVNSLGIPTNVPGVVISGVNNRPPDPGYTGTIRQFPPTQSSYNSALVPVRDGVAPAFWAITSHTIPFCGGQTAFGGVRPGEVSEVVCFQSSFNFPSSFAPSLVNAEAPAVTWTITGANMNTTYGMPAVQYYDAAGNLVCQMQATAIGGDGSWISGSTEGLQYLPSGNYGVQVWNATADGAGEFCGVASVIVWRPSEVPPCIDNDEDGFCSNEDCNDWDATVFPGASSECARGQDRDCNGQDDYQDCYGYIPN